MRWERVASRTYPLNVTVDLLTIKLTSCFSFVMKDSGVSHAPRERQGRETRFSSLSISGKHNFQNTSGNSALFFTKHEVKRMIGLASFRIQMCWPIVVDCSRILSSGSSQKLVAQTIAYHFLLTDYCKVSCASRKSWQEFFSHRLFFYIPLVSQLRLVCLYKRQNDAESPI